MSILKHCSFWILIFTQTVIIFHSLGCSSSERTVFERLRSTKIEVDHVKKKLLKTDFDGRHYFSKYPITFPIFRFDSSFSIRSNIRGKAGIYFVLYSEGEDTLEILKKESKKGSCSTIIRRFKLDKGFNEISFEYGPGMKSHFVVRSRSCKKFVASTPIIYKLVAPAQRELVFLISVDTLSAFHMSLYGYKRRTTPNIDKLARDSVVFTNCYSNSSWTVSSHMSLFTSLLEHQHRVKIAKDYTKNESSDYILKGRFIFPLSPSIPFLIENISRHFITYSLNGGANVSADFGFFRGFDFYFSNNDDLLDPRASEIMFEKIAKRIFDFSFPKAFYFLHTYQVHAPYNPEKEYLDQITKQSELKTFDNLEYLGYRNIFKVFPKRFVENVISLYDAEILSFDRAFGDFIARLKSSGLYENAMIVIVSDHGEEFMEHGSWCHSTNLYDVQLRVPLIIKFPRQQFSGKTVSTNVSLSNVMPTLMEYWGIRMSDIIRTNSLMTLIKERRSVNLDNKMVISSLFRSKPFRYLPGKIAVRGQQFKVIYNEPLRQESLRYYFTPPPYLSQFELYNLEKDPQEQSNLIKAKHGPEVKKMLRHLEALVKQMRKNSIMVTRANRKMPAELIKQLRSLGYLE